MKKYDIVFEILHYMAVGATLKSVEYIIANIDTDNWLIVIVDNASPDDSGAILDQKFHDDDRVIILHNSKNEGFTRGNNYGIRYIRENCDFEYMVVMNNDVMLIETAFLKKLRRNFELYDFAVAGPNVVDKYGTVSNPVAYELPSDRLISERIEGAERMLKYDRFHLMYPYSVIGYSGFFLKRVLKGENRKEYKNEVCRDVILHGSFWIFSKVFFEHYPQLADKEYMYGEEETLQLCISKKKLTSLYIPDILVLHMHTESSRDAYKTKTERLRFAAYNRSRTWKEYIELKKRLDEEERV